VYLRGLRIHSVSSHRITRLITAIAFFVTLSIVLFGQLRQGALLVAAVGAILLWLLSRLTSPVKPRVIRKQLREMGKQRETVRYELSPDTIRIVTDESDSHIPWNRFFKWKEGNGLILAYRSSRLFIPLPIDQFPVDVGDAIRERLAAKGCPLGCSASSRKEGTKPCV
jgi:hypothetical protein